mmetsp:Transcript_106343/g.195220  ORF Transcript_106343/g.195220 Transcript_106343/m.195220 type:complete len:93 (+) Transcript_106343:749-1027(+)
MSCPDAGQLAMPIQIHLPLPGVTSKVTKQLQKNPIAALSVAASLRTEPSDVQDAAALVSNVHSPLQRMVSAWRAHLQEQNFRCLILTRSQMH